MKPTTITKKMTPTMNCIVNGLAFPGFLRGAAPIAIPLRSIPAASGAGRIPTGW
jgi:hypothetical protein